MPISRVRNPSEDLIDRVIQRLKTFSLCIVLEDKPHVAPYGDAESGGDPYFNVVDLKLKDIRDPDYYDTKFVSALVLQQGIGNLTGNNWMPRRGDLVLVAWLNHEKPIVLGNLYCIQQEPVNLPTSDDFYQDIIHKFTQWEEPVIDEANNPAYFPVPAERTNTTCQPICQKQFARNRDQMTTWECPHGVAGDDPQCFYCTSTNYPLEEGVDVLPGAFIRYISKEDYQPNGMDARDASKGEVARRFQFVHHSGSQSYFDDDGTWHLNNAVAQVEKGHIHAAPSGTLDGRSAPDSGTTGSRWKVYAPTDASDDTYAKSKSTTLAAELKHMDTDAGIKIYKNGAVRICNSAEASCVTIDAAGAITLAATSEVNIVAPTVNITGRLYTQEA